MNQEYKQDFIQAGKYAGQVRQFGKELIKPGASYNEVVALIREKIRSLGALPAFPPQIALNDVAAHFLPTPNEDIVFSNEIIKLDIGICYRGAIGDCAVTVDLSGKYQKLIDAAEAALLAAEQIVKVGLPVREIGKVIEKTIAGYGLSSIKNLAGHGLGYYKVHMPPTIPNYEDQSHAIVKAGMTFAIEPFATNGKGLIYEEGKAMIFSQISQKSASSLLATNLLKQIKTFQGLPFAMHDLVSKEMPLQDVDKGLSELLKTGIIAGYAPLVEEAHGMVAQAENSILVDEKGQVLVTTRL